jgi:hypothetical protein
LFLQLSHNALLGSHQLHNPQCLVQRMSLPDVLPWGAQAENEVQFTPIGKACSSAFLRSSTTVEVSRTVSQMNLLNLGKCDCEKGMLLSKGQTCVRIGLCRIQLAGLVGLGKAGCSRGAPTCLLLTDGSSL